MLTPDEIERAAESLRGIVEAVEAGELTATPSILDQLRGAHVALEALLGDQDAGG